MRRVIHVARRALVWAFIALELIDAHLRGMEER